MGISIETKIVSQDGSKQQKTVAIGGKAYKMTTVISASPASAKKKADGIFARLGKAKKH